MQQPHL